MFIAKWSPESLAFEAGKAKKEPEPKYLLDDRQPGTWSTAVDKDQLRAHPAPAPPQESLPCCNNVLALTLGGVKVF